MELIVSLADNDVAFLDAYAGEHALPSRSACLQHAVALLRAAQLSSAYDAAWSEWEIDADAWETTTADSI